MKARIVIGEDDVLLREGIARILTEAGYEVAAQAGDADDLLRKALAHKPDVTVVDVQMPPDRTDDGLRAAIELRKRLPESGVLVLSQHYEKRYALDLIGDHAEGVGYLLKERVGDVDAFVEPPARVAAGGSALDPEIVGRIVGRRGRRRGPGGARAHARPPHRHEPWRPPEPARARRAGRGGTGQAQPRH